MENSSDSRRPDFWSVRYDAGRTPWDFGGIPSALTSFLERSSGPGKVLIPGCGSAYEVKAFNAAGYDVSAIDFSPAAVERSRRVLGPLAERVMVADFFTQDFSPDRFDLVYERTFLCSLHPPRRADYVNRTADLLLPGGRLVGIFLYGESSGSGPPFPMSETAAQELFARRFRLARSDAVTDSLPLFRDMERWQEWIKIR